VHDPHAPGFLVRVALGWVLDVDRVDDPVSPATIEDGAPALRTVGNRQVVTHGASLARFFALDREPGLLVLGLALYVGDGASVDVCPGVQRDRLVQ
jgi:hypothetical protein